MILAEAHLRLLALSVLLSPATEKAARPSSPLTRLRQLTTQELMQLLQSGYPKIDLQLDFSEIDHGLRAINDRRAREQRLDYFIVHGATTALVRQLFRLPVADIKARRRQLLGSHKQRRPQMPEARARDEIHAFWWARRKGLKQTAPTIENFIELHQRFPQFNLATLYAVVSEFEE